MKTPSFDKRKIKFDDLDVTVAVCLFHLAQPYSKDSTWSGTENASREKCTNSFSSLPLRGVLTAGGDFLEANRISLIVFGPEGIVIYRKRLEVKV